MQNSALHWFPIYKKVSQQAFGFLPRRWSTFIGVIIFVGEHLGIAESVNKKASLLQVQREYAKEGEHLRLRIKMSTTRLEELSNHLDVLYRRESE